MTQTSVSEGGPRLLELPQGTLPANGNGSGNGNGKAYCGSSLDFEGPLLRLEQQIRELEGLHAQNRIDATRELRQIRENYTALLRKTYENLSAWETVQVARHPLRPKFCDYVNAICSEFVELHGDRCFGDDRAIRCGLARLKKRHANNKVMLIGHEKGRDTKERIHHNFGMANPEGYRKALRCMRLAEKYHLPVVTLIDTAGAYPGIGAEERGQAEAIARNLMEMSRLRTPILSIIIGEGGSGGAIGLGVSDKVAMLQYAWYSVISPEACSAILMKDNSAVAQLAESLKLTSVHLKRLGVIDAIIPEPLGGAHRDPHQAARAVDVFINRTLREWEDCNIDKLIERRYEKFRNMGIYLETGRAAAALAG